MDFIGKSVTSNKKYPVYFDDVVSFLGYCKKCDATNLLEQKYHHNIDYVELKESQISERDDILFNKPIIGKNMVHITKDTFS